MCLVLANPICGLNNYLLLLLGTASDASKYLQVWHETCFFTLQVTVRFEF